MGIIFVKRYASALLTAVIILALPVRIYCAETDPFQGWRFYAYRGRWSKTIFVRIVFRLETDFRDSWITAAGIGKDIFSFGKNLQAEGEINAGKHCGKQTHPEINALLSLRWKKFPWDRHLNTSLAFGSGISYAGGTPSIERRRKTSDPVRPLKYMMIEKEAILPGLDGWSLFLRVHHRSGVFGLFQDAQGSNIVGLGIRGSF